MGSCGALSGGDAAKRCLVEMLRSAVQWRCCKRCLVEMLQARLVEMLRSAAWWRCGGALLALLDEGTVA